MILQFCHVQIKELLKLAIQGFLAGQRNQNAHLWHEHYTVTKWYWMTTSSFSHLESLISILCKQLHVLSYKTQTKAQFQLAAHFTADTSNVTTV